ncbi:hypothetical protein ACFL96_04120 [Thermoproteota archaeon]
MASLEDITEKGRYIPKTRNKYILRADDSLSISSNDLYVDYNGSVNDKVVSNLRYLFHQARVERDQTRLYVPEVNIIASKLREKRPKHVYWQVERATRVAAYFELFLPALLNLKTTSGYLKQCMEYDQMVSQEYKLLYDFVSQGGNVFDSLEKSKQVLDCRSVNLFLSKAFTSISDIWKERADTIKWVLKEVYDQNLQES